MAVFDHWAYIFALILHAPLRLEAAVVAPPREAQAAQHGSTARTRTVLSQPLPKLDGDHLAVHMVEVRYGPGESNAAHSHPCPVIGYVLTGAVRMQVQDPGSVQPGPVTVYRAGESFYEAPNGRHLVSANASQTEPTTFLATFVCDHPTELSVPAPSTKGDSRP
ncbi:cupin domain-containing protein [Edaphobacter bradus]|uniref:cupin domain-containing protein n=1 Tax=Edaphobacter bradus TaxID=2259016 RepID=UPI0021DFE976|nr:cupin domain-containing protein [Edaphobacter bradus]